MDRRKALKGLGLSVGYVIATPTIISMLQSCKTDVAVWKPIFLTIDEGIVVRNLVDLMLPKTEATPGAIDVNVPEFLDLFASKVYTEERQAHLKTGLKGILRALKVEDNNASVLKTEDYDALLAKYLKANKEEVAAFKNNEEDLVVLDALTALRSASIWAYTNTEEIGENVLAYDPIPGRQQGCISVEEATGGKAWSL
jgi:hypothetical protein